MIGKLTRVPLRDVWPHEAYDFTAWLQSNLEVLNDVLNLSLASAEREQAAGSFNVDLVAEDQSGNTVIIENQLERSDHDHLGKLLTYLVAFDALAAIWIVSDPRPEHVSVINWLNESPGADFYLVKLEAVRIGESDSAPLLTLIVGPTEEARLVGQTKKELSERHHIRRDFWESLLERAKKRTPLHANLSATSDNWLAAGAGRSNLTYVYRILQYKTFVELVIDLPDAVENARILEYFHIHKDSIEEQFGAPLEWSQVEGRRKCIIAKELSGGGYRDRDNWEEIQHEMIDAMIRLEESLNPHIRRL